MLFPERPDAMIVSYWVDGKLVGILQAHDGLLNGQLPTGLTTSVTEISGGLSMALCNIIVTLIDVLTVQLILQGLSLSFLTNRFT